MESQAKDKTFHAVSEAALISLQCGFHLFKRGDVLQFKKNFWQPDNINLTLPKKTKTVCPLVLLLCSCFKFHLHFSKSKVGCKDAHRKAWQLEHLSISQPTLIQPYLAHINGESMRGLPAHFKQCGAKGNFNLHTARTCNNNNIKTRTKMAHTDSK